MYNIKKNDLGGWEVISDPNGPFTILAQANMAAWQASMVENMGDTPEIDPNKLQRIIKNNSERK